MADAKISALVAATTPLAGTEVVPVVQSSSTKKVSIANLTAGRTVAMRNADLTGGAAVINIGATADNTYHYVRTIDNDGQAFYLGNDNAAGSFFSAGAYGRVLYSEGAKPVKVFVNGAYRAEYDTSGNYKLDTGNLIIGTSGKGIDFTQDPNPAGMTSELLDDYEEGTWTPTLVGTTTDPTVTYSLQRGVYTKVGRLVTVTVYMGWSAFSGGSGDVGFGGLPFAIEGTVGAGSSGAVGYFDGFTLTVGRTSVGIFASPNTSYCVPTCFGSAVSTQFISVGSVAGAGTLAYQMTYFT
jgi:hypothetical protein